MSNNFPFKLYQVKSKAPQQAFVYMGKPFKDSVGSDSFYPHMVNKKCEDLYLFTTLVGSKNIQFTPSKLIPPLAEGNPKVITDPFIHIDSRWYHFRYPGREDDIPENLPPNDFIKTYTKKTDGDYIVEWRKLTSDGSVLIKGSTFSTVLWNGSKYISDAAAGYDEGPTHTSTINDDLIYLKTRHFIEVIRNTIKSNSLSIIYKKYIDECKWKSTFLMKRFRGSYCINVVDNSNKAIQVGLKNTPTCNCGCVTCWELIDDSIIERYSRIKTLDNESEYDSSKVSLTSKWEEYKAALTEDAEGIEMTWLEQFEYNWLDNVCYNRYQQFPIVVKDEKTVEVKFKRYSDRQNRFYGISPKTSTREHHAMPPVKTSDDIPHIYSYKNTHSLHHPPFTFGTSQYDRYATRKTKFITMGRIDDGKERVVVPPGVIFRSYKAIPGVLSLYELDVPYRRPDEYHFAVDNYGNILGYKNLPYPGLLQVEHPVESCNLNPAAPDEVKGTIVKDAWQCYFDNDKAGFCDESRLDAIHKHRIDNKFFVVSKTLNPEDHDELKSCEQVSTSGWNMISDLQSNRKSHASVSTSLGVVVVGGFDIPTEILISCEVMDTFGNWSYIDSLSERRYGHTASMVTDTSGGEYIFVAGGYNEENGVLKTCELYNVSTGTWQALPNMIMPRIGHTSIFIPSTNSLYVIGGYNGFTSSNCPDKEKNYLNTVEVFDISLGTWNLLGNTLSSAKAYHTSTLLPDDTILVYGGYTGNGLATKYDIINGIYVSSFSMSYGRRDHTATSLPSGDVVIAGGFNQSGALAACEMFLYGSNFVTSIGSMNYARGNHAAVYAGGLVKVTGGYNLINVLSSTENYDYGTDIWSADANLNVARYKHTSVTDISGNNVYVIDGYADSIINEIENVSGGGTHTYVNIHHCPIWIDKDIFCSYLATENPKKFQGNSYGNDCTAMSCTPSGSPETSSSSSSTYIPSSSSSSSSDTNTTVIVIDDPLTPEVPTVTTENSSSSSIIETDIPRPSVVYEDDLQTKNTVHGFVDENTDGIYTFTVPNGVNRIKVMVWGAGAGGGGYAHIDVTNEDREHSLTKASGGGGGGGAHVRMMKDVLPSTTYTFTIGKGGKTGQSVVVDGKANSSGTITWYDGDGNTIAEPSSINGANGENGGNSSFGGTLVAYGGKAGIGATVQRGTGIAGRGGWGSSGGLTPSVKSGNIYKGINGKDGEFIHEGPKGPALFGGASGFAESASGGSCAIQGAGHGGDGQRTNSLAAVTVDGQDGRVRIEW